MKKNEKKKKNTKMPQTTNERWSEEEELACGDFVWDKRHRHLYSEQASYT